MVINMLGEKMCVSSFRPFLCLFRPPINGRCPSAVTILLSRARARGGGVSSVECHLYKRASERGDGREKKKRKLCAKGSWTRGGAGGEDGPLFFTGVRFPSRRDKNVGK